MWISHEYTYIPLPLNPFSHPSLSPHQVITDLNSVCYTSTSCELSVLHMVMYIVDVQYCINFCCTVELILFCRTSLVAQLVKNPPAVWETWVQTLIWEDPLVKGKATHSTVLVWRIPWTMQSTFTFVQSTGS